MMHMMMITWSWLWSHSYCLDELLMTMEIEPLLYDVAPDDGGVFLVQLMHMVMTAMAYDWWWFMMTMHNDGWWWKLWWFMMTMHDDDWWWKLWWFMMSIDDHNYDVRWSWWCTMMMAAMMYNRWWIMMMMVMVVTRMIAWRCLWRYDMCVFHAHDDSYPDDRGIWFLQQRHLILE